MSLNGAILDEINTPCWITGEKLFYEQVNVDLEYESGQGYPGQGNHYFCQSGTLYLTNIRVVYVPKGEYSFFKNMNIPLLNLKGGKLVQPWWDANRYQGTVEPVPNGGLRLQGSIKFIFKSGGGFEFSSIFLQLRSRISDTDDLQDECLPLYQESSSSQTSGTSRLHVVPLPLNPDGPPSYETK